MPTSNKSNDDTQQSLFTEMCCAGEFAPHVHRDEVLAVKSPCTGRGRRNIVTCGDEGRGEFLEEVDGLDITGVNVRGSTFPLDTFLPVIPRGMFLHSASEIPSSVVGVMLNDVLTKKVTVRHGYYYLPEDTHINTEVLKYPVFQGKHVILLSCGQDILIETLWWKRHSLGLFQTIASMGFLAVTGMNFSIFSGECPFAHALNTKKSLRYCEWLDQLGVWAIPHIYAINRPQRERSRDWLLARPHIKLITINTQLQRNRKRDVRQVFETVEFLLKNTEVNILLHGRGRGLSSEIRSRYPHRLHFAASGPLKNAIIRKDKTPAEYIDLFVDGLALYYRP